MDILRVAVPVPIHTVFDYLPPQAYTPEQLRPGIRVLVPFGRGERCGVLLETGSESKLKMDRLKRALVLMDKLPLLSSCDLAFLRWAAAYYQHPVGEVISAALPSRLRKGKQPLKQTKTGWTLTPFGAAQNPAKLRRAPRQQSILRMLQAVTAGISQCQLDLEYGESRPILRRLEQKGLVERCVIQPDSYKHGTVAAPTLNQAQQRAVETIDSGSAKFGVYLLDGVTGSGKTEVYLRLIELTVARGLQALILVPEIGLTPQLLRRFQQRLSASMVVMHSALSATEREHAWHDARQGRADVVLGTRSAVLTPFASLGLILVDEEHDLSFKQQEGFRYSARDMAVVRAQHVSCPIVLGSATPALGTLHNAYSGRYHHLVLSERAGDAIPPRLDLLDIRSVKIDGGVSPTLARLLEEETTAGNQVLLFLNRRGYAPQLTCYECGWIAQCSRCDARMTLHLEQSLLWCHHCGARRPMDHQCPGCGNGKLRTLGQGTERLEEVLHKRLPELRIVRIDRDSTRRKGSFELLLNDIREGKYRLLLGTQMLAKGHHFPDVTLVGILDVDQGLFGADFRAAERMAQLIIQVAGRAGRGSKPGRVIIQTRHPDHPLLQTLIRKGYPAFARESLAERRAAYLPPFSHQALLRAEANKPDSPAYFLEHAAQLAKEIADKSVEFWGPVPAPMERRAGRYRAHLLVQSEQRSTLQRLLSGWIPKLQSLKLARFVRWSIDVDPQEMT